MAGLVAREAPPRLDASADVVVVGAGACGLVAALRARASGAEVIVLERDPSPSGSTSMSSGFVPAPATRFQRAAGIEDDTADLFEADIQAKSKHRSVPHLASLAARTIGPALEWLGDEAGIEWLVLTDFLYPGHGRHRMHAVPEKTGAALLARLLAAAERAGIPIVAGARATRLFVSGDKVEAQRPLHHATRGPPPPLRRGGSGVVAGPDLDPPPFTGEGDRRRRWRGRSIAGQLPRIDAVGIARPGGASEIVGCKALVLACNGYGGNAGLVARHIPEMAGGLYYGHAGNTGDALIWGEALGAKLEHLSAYQGHGSLAHPHGILISWALMTKGAIQVNAAGERFSDESGGYSEQAVAVLVQPGGIAWNVFDRRIHDFALSFPDYREAVAAGAVRKAGNVSELAAAIGAPREVLQNTLDEVETSRRGQGADPFGRDFQNLPPLEPPYCAVRVTGALFHTQGGLMIDGAARVLDAHGRAFPNLFAGGGAACGVSGPEVSGYLSGNGLLTAIAFGFVAGTEAAQASR